MGLHTFWQVSSLGSLGILQQRGWVCTCRQHPTHLTLIKRGHQMSFIQPNMCSICYKKYTTVLVWEKTSVSYREGLDSWFYCPTSLLSQCSLTDVHQSQLYVSVSRSGARGDLAVVPRPAPHLVDIWAERERVRCASNGKKTRISRLTRL